jgi:hypothetical protein
VKKNERVSVEVFEILAQQAAAVEPSESALDHPTSRQKCKPFGLVGAFDDFDSNVLQDACTLLRSLQRKLAIRPTLVQL